MKKPRFFLIIQVKKKKINYLRYYKINEGVIKLNNKLLI